VQIQTQLGTELPDSAHRGIDDGSHVRVSAKHIGEAWFDGYSDLEIGPERLQNVDGRSRKDAITKRT
jgi:hypothetical protein